MVVIQIKNKDRSGDANHRRLERIKTKGGPSDPEIFSRLLSQAELARFHVVLVRVSNHLRISTGHPPLHTEVPVSKVFPSQQHFFQSPPERRLYFNCGIRGDRGRGSRNTGKHGLSPTPGTRDHSWTTPGRWPHSPHCAILPKRWTERIESGPQGSFATPRWPALN